MGRRGRDYWLARVDRIKQWREPGQTGRRAPHKPLLLLHALARLHNDRTSRVRYEELAPRLSSLLTEFGPPRKANHPEQPFWRLQTDDLWSVTTQGDSAVVTGSGNPSHRRLLDAKAVGQLAGDFEAELLSDPGLLIVVARSLLASNWPESLHADICLNVGLDLEALESGVASDRVQALVAGVASDRLQALVDEKRRRDPDFRVRVLRAYDYQCAMCGFDGRLDSTTVGLEAAHVQWWAEGGPDHTFNGLCLCVMHHKLFDRGVLGLGRSRRILVSSHFVGRNDAAEDLVTSLIGTDMRPPRSDADMIGERHRSWHEREVFRGPARR